MTRREALLMPAAAFVPAPLPALRSVDLFVVPYPLVAAFTFFPKPERPTVFVKITAEDGTAGWGQSVPLPTWSYETVESAVTTIRGYLAPAIAGCDPGDIPEIHRRMNKAIAPSFSTGMPIAKAWS